MTSMKLYDTVLSPFAARCRIVIDAKGLDVELTPPPAYPGSDEFRALAPIAKIPILIVDGEQLPGSMAICEYLDDRFPSPALRPKDPAERHRMRLLSQIDDLYIAAPLFSMLPHLSRRTRDEDFVAQKLGDLDQGLASLDHFLAAEGYAVGDSLTLADCCLLPTIFFAIELLPFLGRPEPLKAFPKISVWWRFIQGDEFCARTVADLNQGLADHRAEEEKKRSAKSA